MKVNTKDDWLEPSCLKKIDLWVLFGVRLCITTCINADRASTVFIDFKVLINLL